MCLMTGKHDMSSERITGPAAGRYNVLPMKGAFNVTCQMTEGKQDRPRRLAVSWS